MSPSFEHTTLGQRVLFGTGLAGENLCAEVARLGARKVMVISSASEARRLAAVTDSINVTLHYDDVAPHVPPEKAEKARAAAAENGIDLVVCAGGGSTTGLAKAVALTLRLPIIAIPTTYAGSEATNVWGIDGGIPEDDGRR
jgi:maleylacetate reductase